MIRQRSDSEADAFATEWAALEMRYVGSRPGSGLPADPAHPAQARLWVRVNGRLSDDPLEHLAAFTYASDLTLLGAALVPHGLNLGSPRLQPASLDHTDLVPPAVPGRRVVALRPVVADGGRRPRPRAGPGLRPGRHAGRHRRPGGPDPGPPDA